MADRLGIPGSTLYRTVRDLVGAGFLAPAAEAHYRLGTALIHFDRIIRLTDPLMTHGQTTLRQLTEAAEIECVGLLCNLYANQVMCVADATAGKPRFKSSYERGRLMPIMRGATSRVILANLPARKLKQILANEPDITPEREKEFRKDIQETRKQGFRVSYGEIDEGLAGLAVPVLVPDLHIMASLSLVVNQADLTSAQEQRLVMILITSASLLVKQLKNLD